ncbi:MAG: sodium:proton antiporter NhaD [Parachlamydia sp.]|nr:sodium:proton antiporter NhaD [Parachlamydia sp.]
MEINLEEITHHASWVLAVFLIGYTAIVVEQVVKFNKSATALLMAIGCWTLLFAEPAESVDRHLFILTFQMFKVSQVLFFLMGALTIVEIINAHKGFRIITEKLLISSKRKMLWTTGIVTFFLSAVLDNLTTTIVMVSLISKLVQDREERLMLGGTIVIAANAGGAWTPIGDVATTLLWINGQVSTVALLRTVFIPSILGLVACLLWFSTKFKGEFQRTDVDLEKTEPGGTLVLILGICSLIFVPFFKILTNLPAFMGMMFGLAVMWVATDLLHYRYSDREHLRVTSILPKVDISVILFYLGVLLSINSLESAGILKNLALWLNASMPNLSTIPILIGLVSSIVDNVSLVAATIGMYGLTQFPLDSPFWLATAYCAGTGGSILIIGSAAGVALMAMEKVDFMWYTRRITLPALLAYFTGVSFFYLVSY